MVDCADPGSALNSTDLRSSPGTDSKNLLYKLDFPNTAICDWLTLRLRDWL